MKNNYKLNLGATEDGLYRMPTVSSNYVHMENISPNKSSGRDHLRNKEYSEFGSSVDGTSNHAPSLRSHKGIGSIVSCDRNRARDDMRYSVYAQTSNYSRCQNLKGMNKNTVLQQRNLNQDLNNIQIRDDPRSQKRPYTKLRGVGSIKSKTYYQSRKASTRSNIVEDDPTVSFINYLSKYGIIDYNWRTIISERNMKKLKHKAEKIFYQSSK